MRMYVATKGPKGVNYMSLSDIKIFKQFSFNDHYNRYNFCMEKLLFEPKQRLINIMGTVHHRLT